MSKTITEISTYIKELVNKKVTIIGEVMQPKLSNGHLYFSLKDSKSSIRAIIWKFNENIDKNEINEGNKITAECKIDYYGTSGSLNLILYKLLDNQNIGELYLKYERIKKEFYEKGYFGEQNKLKLPLLIKKILILTSLNGAALQDFIYNIQSNKSKIVYEIKDIKVQGVDCPKSICDELKNLKYNYDLIVITRGGGSFEELFGFSDASVVEQVYKCNIPILSAIGHQTDSPLLDLVADYNMPTPSLASQFIINHNKKYLESLHDLKNTIKYDLINFFQKKINELNQQKNLLKELIKPLIELKIKFLYEINNEINLKKIFLKECRDKLENNNIILMHNGNIIENNCELDKYKNEMIEMIWKDKIYKIKIVE